VKWQNLGANLPRRRNPLAKFIGRAFFRITGWKIEGEFPDLPRVVVALTPHTSNMDFILTLGVLWGLGLKSSFLMKHSLFWFPLGWVLTAMGGIPVDRKDPQGLVDGMVSEFQRRDRLVLGITPEGTRSGVRQWKTGFARIAAKAKIPVVPAVLNYETRTVYFASVITGLQDAEGILARVKAASAGGRACHA